MSDSKQSFTPGPWEFIDATKSASYKFAPTCIIRAGQKQVASFSWNDNSPWFPTMAQSQANARLIAAAPELLQALKELLDLTDDPQNDADPEESTFAFARSVIAKAGG